MRDKYISTVSARIKAARTKQGLTIRAFAAICNMDVSALSRLENGQKDMHLSTLKRIAEALEIDMKALV